MAYLKIFLLIGGFCLGFQWKTQAQQKCGKTPQMAIAVLQPTKHQSPLPPNYKPPVADRDHITFPETNASKNRQRKLRKRRKKSRHKGCPATRL